VGALCVRRPAVAWLAAGVLALDGSLLVAGDVKASGRKRATQLREAFFFLSWLHLWLVRAVQQQLEVAQGVQQQQQQQQQQQHGGGSGVGARARRAAAAGPRWGRWAAACAHGFGLLLLAFHANVRRLYTLPVFEAHPLLFTLLQVVPEVGAVGSQLLFFASLHTDLAHLDRELGAFELTDEFDDLLGQSGGMEAAVGGRDRGLRRR
jgi:hypothetical protein